MGVLINVGIFVAGMIVGALIYRNNAKKIEREFNGKFDEIKYRIDILRQRIESRLEK